MYIVEFATRYCADQLAEFKDNSKLVSWADLPYEEIIDDPITGKRVPVVYIDGVAVPNRDFIEMEESAFVEAHNTPNAARMYRNYIKGLEILEGSDVILKYLTQAEKETEQLGVDARLMDLIS